MQVRKAMFAGSWYPKKAGDCRQEIEAFLAEGQQWAVPSGAFVGGIVPHAGWYFSGSLASSSSNAGSVSLDATATGSTLAVVSRAWRWLACRRALRLAATRFGRGCSKTCSDRPDRIRP